MALFKNKIPQEVIDLLDCFKGQYEAYLVGGCFRDFILRKEPHDWDICTSAKPEQIIELFESKGYKTIPTGIKHGTVTVLFGRGQYEITTYRIDGNYSDGRRPDSVEFTDDIVQDLSRRDFTMNAIAYNSADDEWVDPFYGEYDLRNHLVRCVGNPDERFQEDALRILRALRFSLQLRGDIEYFTLRAMYRNVDLLDNISTERIQSELNKMLVEDYVGKNFRGIGELIIMKIIPELKPCKGFDQHNPHHDYDIWRHTTMALDSLTIEGVSDLIVKMAVLFHDIGKSSTYTNVDGIGHFYGHAAVSVEIADTIIRRLKYNNATREAVVELIKYHDAELVPDAKNVKKWLNRIGEEQFRRLIEVQIGDKLGQTRQYRAEHIEQLYKVKEILEQVLKEQQCFTLKDLTINGNDLIQLGMKPGKKIGMILNKILNEIIEGNLPNSKEALVEYAKTLIGE